MYGLFQIYSPILFTHRDLEIMNFINTEHIVENMCTVWIK